MCLPFFNLFVGYDALLCGWCVAYVGDASVLTPINFTLLCLNIFQSTLFSMYNAIYYF
jgi:hypothetical protein